MFKSADSFCFCASGSERKRGGAETPSTPPPPPKQKKEKISGIKVNLHTWHLLPVYAASFFPISSFRCCFHYWTVLIWLRIIAKKEQESKVRYFKQADNILVSAGDSIELYTITIMTKARPSSRQRYIPTGKPSLVSPPKTKKEQKHFYPLEHW